MSLILPSLITLFGLILIAAGHSYIGAGITTTMLAYQIVQEIKDYRQRRQFKRRCRQAAALLDVALTQPTDSALMDDIELQNFIAQSANLYIPLSTISTWTAEERLHALDLAKRHRKTPATATA